MLLTEKGHVFGNESDLDHGCKVIRKKKARCEKGMSEEKRSREFVKLIKIKQIHQIQSIVMPLEINE